MQKEKNQKNLREYVTNNLRLIPILENLKRIQFFAINNIYYPTFLTDDPCSDDALNNISQNINFKKCN